MLKLFLYLLLINFCASANVLAQVVHKERSLYRNILVEDDGDLRCLKFNVKSSKTQQSCYLKSHPEKLVFNYNRLLMASLFANPEPKRILIIGLGGGTMSKALGQLFPKSQIDNVDIDPAVIKVAKKYFGFYENEQIKAYSQDGRIFIKRALLKKQQYDWIILDAFNGDYIPEHLLTKEFLQEAKLLLSEEGILSANTFSISKLYAFESATYKAVFGDFYQVKNSRNSNRIILVRKNGFTKLAINAQQLTSLSKKLTPYQINVTDLYHSMYFSKQYQDWSEDTPVLTDQFSPANLLNSYE